MRPRITGTEFETAISTDVPVAEIEMLILNVRDQIPEYLASAGLWLSNGAKYYKDLSHLEYATPEDTSIAGTVINERAGEQIVMESIDRHLLLGPAIARQIGLDKRVLDDHGRTWGYHINLSAEPDVLYDKSQRNLAVMALHLATAVPLTGAGAIVHTGYGDNKQAFYSFGQKMMDIEEDFNDMPTMRKSLVNVRRRPYADEKALDRVHIISTDANVSDWASFMNIGMASLVLRAIEQGVTIGMDFAPVGGHKVPYVYLARRTATDTAVAALTTMSDGRKLRAMDVQEMLLERVAKTDHTDEEAYVLEQWRYAVADMRRDPMLLRNRSGGIAKLAALQRKQVRLGLEPNDFTHRELRLVDRSFDRLSTHTREVATISSVPRIHPRYKETLVPRLRSKQFAEYTISDSDVQHAMVYAPSTTRAALRAKAILNGEVWHYDKMYSMAWDSYTDKDSMQHRLTDPYNHTVDVGEPKSASKKPS